MKRVFIYQRSSSPTAHAATALTGGLRSLLAAGLLLTLSLGGRAAEADGPQQPKTAGPTVQVLRDRYVLGPGDQITIWALGAEEIGDKPLRVDTRGKIDVALIGSVQAGGLTLDELKASLTDRLRTQIREPRVSVNIVDYHSQPVSVLGAVNNPGLQQLQGTKTLAEVIAMAGGVRPDASYSIHITRQVEWGPIPLTTAKVDPSGRFTVADVKLKSLMEAQAPEENISVRPFDIITVPRAQMVYVIGDVNKSGGFALNEREDVTVLRALSLAGGLTRTAKGSNARILRGNAEISKREEISVDVTKVLSGKAEDVALRSDDLLFIPSSTAKRGAVRALEAAITIGTGVVIWRH